MEKRFFTQDKVFLWIAALVAIVVRLRHADMALERDEGEYAYAGWLILHKGVPYLDFYNMKLPGVYYSYALIYKLLGLHIWSVRVAVLALTMGSAFFIHGIAKRVLPAANPEIAAGSYLLASIGYFSQGFISNCEHFVVFWMLSGVWVMSRWQDWKGAAAAGFLMGISLLMKQHALHFAMFAVAWMSIQYYFRRDFWDFFRRMAAFGVAYLLPFGLIVLDAWRDGAIEHFVFFTFEYAAAYTGINKPEWVHIERFFASIFIDNMGLWVVYFAGIYPALRGRLSRQVIWLFLFFVFSFWAIVPGWYFRPHYYQMLFPSAALIVGWVFGRMNVGLWQRYRPYVLWVCMLLTLTRHVEYFFIKSDETVMNEKYRGAYFVEVRKVGEWLFDHSKPSDVVAMHNNEPQIAFYAKRRAASSYLYMYPLFEKHKFATKMVEQYINETETSGPTWFVDTDYIGEEFPNKDAKRQIDAWKREYLKDFKLRGVMYWTKDGNGLWEPEVTTPDPKRRVLLYLYQRK